VLPQHRLLATALGLVGLGLALHSTLCRGPAALLARRVHTATYRPAARRRVYQHSLRMRVNTGAVLGIDRLKFDSTKSRAATILK